MLTITLLGTAATMPLPDRALTAAVAECGGHSLLLDCGEGTQTAARRAGVNLMKLDAICLTHYHGDHRDLHRVDRRQRQNVYKRQQIYWQIGHPAEKLNRHAATLTFP